MKTGQQLEVLLNYHSLYKLNPEAARSAMLEVWSQTGNISKTARMFSTTRRVVQLAIEKQLVGNLADKSHQAITVHNRTEGLVEEKVIALKNSTKFGYRRVAKDLREKQGLQIKDSTVRNILKRARGKGLLKGEKVRSSNGKTVRFYDWYTAEPFEIIQTDLKVILDKKALPQEVYHHTHKGQSQENGFVERSHRTDDEEFYIPRLQTIKNNNQFFLEALNWQWYYNTKRSHTGEGMNDSTPYQKLQKQYCWIPKDICAFPPLLLDNISTNIGPLGGYNHLAHYLIHDFYFLFGIKTEDIVKLFFYFID